MLSQQGIIIYRLRKNQTVDCSTRLGYLSVAFGNVDQIIAFSLGYDGFCYLMQSKPLLFGYVFAPETEDKQIFLLQVNVASMYHTLLKLHHKVKAFIHKFLHFFGRKFFLRE